jgi:hypothetical protein
MRTWRLEVANDAACIFTAAQIAGLESRQLRADDEEDANELAVALLGIALVPCCEDDGELCFACDADARLTADLRADDRAMDQAREREAEAAGDAQDRADHEREAREDSR